MVIGIHGKISSGKDTSAEMLKFLFSWKLKNTKFEDYSKLGHIPVRDPFKRIVEIKKFAGTLKQIVCLLTGCNIAALEDQTFKDRAIPGWDRSISDARTWLAFKFVGQDMSFYNYTDSQIVDVASEQGFKWQRTYREMLQELGTNVFRQHFDADTWVKALFSTYKDDETWIISDVRFPNECASILDRKGILIKVERPGLPSNDHISETALDSFNGWDYILKNDGTYEHLFNQIQKIYAKIQHDNS
jgi:hypothetical protein